MRTLCSSGALSESFPTLSGRSTKMSHPFLPELDTGYLSRSYVPKFRLDGSGGALIDAGLLITTCL